MKFLRSEVEAGVDGDPYFQIIASKKFQGHLKV